MGLLSKLFGGGAPRELKKVAPQVRFFGDIIDLPQRGMFGLYSRSPNGRFILAWRDSNEEGTHGGARTSGLSRYVLLDNDKIACEGRLERPNDGKVADTGVFILNDWHFSTNKLRGTFYAFRPNGSEILRQRCNANLYNNGVSRDGRHAACHTCNSDDERDSAVLTIFGLEAGNERTRWRAESGWPKGYEFSADGSKVWLDYPHGLKLAFTLDGDFLDRQVWMDDGLARGDTYTAADEAASKERRILSAVQRNARIRELEARCVRAQDAEKRQREAQQGAAAILVTDEMIKRIRRIAKEEETVTNRLHAAATVVAFDIPPERLPGIDIDGVPLTTEQRSLQAVEPMTIAIPERGRITIEPAIQDRDKLLRQQRAAKAKLKGALEEAGVNAVDDAEEQYVRRETLLRDADIARQEAELHAPANDDHEAGGQVLADHIAGLQKILGRELEDLGLQVLPANQEAEETLRTAQSQAADVRHGLESARATLGGPEETLSELQTNLGTFSARHDDGKSRLARLRSRLEEAEKDSPENYLQSRITAARSDLAVQESAVVDLQAQRMGETLPLLEARIARLEKAIQDRRDKRENLKVKISGLRSHVEAVEGAGLDEAIQQAERERELCEEEGRRCEREVQVLTLLLSTLRATEHEAKERYLSPVLNRVRPYLQLLFPGADISINEDLHIVGVVREAGYEEAFDHLSMGTQEQIAVLIRLAFAEMLVEQSRPATVILDDALVFSDDRRMSRMFDILNLAAQKVQVIVLTCREQFFEELGGRPLSLVPGNSEELISA